MENVISVIINVDTRSGFDGQVSKQGEMFDGTRSIDFMIDGVLNKHKLFRDHNHEIILHIDVHNPIPKDVNDRLHQMFNDGILTSIIYWNHHEYFNHNSHYHKYNDISYVNAISQARGKYVAHFDGDMVCFVSDAAVINDWISMVDSGRYDYISYPSPWSPDPVLDPAFDKYYWASTRFFFCKRDVFDFTEIVKCLLSDEYLYGKYGEQNRRCPWLEHVLGMIAGRDRVFYLPIKPQKYLMWSWNAYLRGTLHKLNNTTHDKIIDFAKRCGGITFPCDLNGNHDL